MDKSAKMVLLFLAVGFLLLGFLQVGVLASVERSRQDVVMLLTASPVPSPEPVATESAEEASPSASPVVRRVFPSPELVPAESPVVE